MHHDRHDQILAPMVTVYDYLFHFCIEFELFLNRRVTLLKYESYCSANIQGAVLLLFSHKEF